MSVEVKCPNCGKMTQIGRMVCQNCSVRLEGIKPGDFRNAKPKKVKQYGSGNAGGNAVGVLVKLIVTLALLASMGLFLWPKESSGTTGSADDSVRGDQKLDVLKDGVDNGRQAKVILSEEEINGFFAHVLIVEESDSSGPDVDLAPMMVDLREGEIEFTLSTKIGPLTWSRQLVFEPTIRNGAIELELKSAHFGHLPMPGALMGMVQDNCSKVFGDMEREKSLWNNTGTIESEDGNLTLTSFVK
jgi:hypothetical protein